MKRELSWKDLKEKREQKTSDSKRKLPELNMKRDSNWKDWKEKKESKQ